MNRIFAGKHIGLPKIGAGIGGGDWGAIESAIKNNLRSCDVTIVTFNSTPNKDIQVPQPLKNIQ
jgi:O-acetyl-ADP-ribose deacetylase (regulator of RNase III)